MYKSDFEEMLRNQDSFDANTLSDYIFHSHDGIFIVDQEGTLIVANPAVANMIGIPFGDLMGNRITDIVDSGAYTGSPSIEAAKTKKTYTGLVKTRTGVEIMSTSKPIYDDQGQLRYVITNCRPLSVIKGFFDKFMKHEKGFSDTYYDFENTPTKYVYSSDAMKDVLKRCYYVAQTDCSVMLLGETGSGKGVMSQYIHENSTRAKEKFLELNCAALPENLLESELFGYEKGAFTGASAEGKQGLLEIAHNGTVFLDEIGEMPLQLQAKLLKVLDSGYLLRVGGTIYRKINVRIISATHRNLHEMIKNGQFREDLYYRLNVVSIKIPPLRERGDGIKDIVNHLLEKTNKLYSCHKTIDENAMQVLLSYNWPGNIRQMDNFMQKASILSMGSDALDADFLSSLLEEEFPIYANQETAAPKDEGKPTIAKPESAEPRAGKEYEPLKDYMARIEADYIKKCIDDCGGSISKAADKLGIHRTAIYKKMKE